MDQPAYASPIQQLHQQDHVRTTKTSMGNVYDNSTPVNQISSTLRRQLEESNSPDKGYQRQVKKQRPHGPAATTMPATAITSPSRRQFGFPIRHLKHAIANRPPCFFIKFTNNSKDEQHQIPSIMNTAKWIKEVVFQQSDERIEEFSLFIPAGNNRYKFGVASKEDFLKLWRCNWPNKMNQMEVEVERPRALPDSCALVIRYIPPDINVESRYKEITKTLKSAVALTKINYHRKRTTNDYRFCVTDSNEYDEIIKIGRIAMGHLLLPITPFIPGLNMTYCNNCWELGHTRTQCKIEPRCRKCLDRWDPDHRCQKPVLCAQCQGTHPSLSLECIVVKNYRKTLQEEVNMAIKGGIITQMDGNKKQKDIQQMNIDFPTLKPNINQQPTWGNQKIWSNAGQSKQEQEQLKEIKKQTNNVLDATRRMETKLDTQVLKLENSDKWLSINKQGILVIANIMQQTIDTLLIKEKKNQVPVLQESAQQMAEFKRDITEKFNTLSFEQQQQPSNSLAPQTNNNQTTDPTIRIATSMPTAYTNSLPKKQKVISWGFPTKIVKCVTEIVNEWFSGNTVSGILDHWEKRISPTTTAQLTPLNILIYNVQGWGSRALESVEMTFKSDSSICVFTEVGELWNKSSIPHFKTFYQKGTNTKGGVVVAIGIYWPQCQKRNLNDLKAFVTERTIIAGDFNATAEEWNSPTTDPRGAHSGHLFADDLCVLIKAPIKTVMQLFYSQVKRPDVKIEMEGVRLETVDSFKYLGFTWTNKMSLKPTVDQCLSKAEKALAKLKWLKRGRKISVPVLRQCMFAYVFPHLAWIFPLYPFLPITQRSALDSKFRVAIRTVHSCPYVSAHLALDNGLRPYPYA
ncbi:hypothetical protein I4U23_021964 [Adineta vaga]|nr:hypothetical protein I4U23_021964 [Adineta vaga]